MQATPTATSSEEARRSVQRSIYPWSGHDHRNPTVKRLHDERTLGERVADAVARFGGSWPFIFIFVGLIFGWMLVNTVFLARVLGHKQLDPYPYIALNLMLSAVAGLQAPIIMMSQNRASARDEALAGHHYEESQKAEQILGTLHGLLQANTDLTQQVHDLTVQIHRVVAADPRGPAAD